MGTRVWLAALVVALTGLGGCSGDDRSPVDTVQGSWRLTTMTLDGLVYPMDNPGRPDPTMTVDGYRVSGDGGCNQFGAEVAEDGDVLTVNLGAATMIGCPGARGTIERAYFDGLAAVTAATLDGSDLVLTGDDVTMTFRGTEDGGGER